MLLHIYPEGAYIAIDGPSNERGDSHTLPGVGINGWTVTMISKNSKAPERAIALMSCLMSEHGQKLKYCGVEGVTYDVGADGVPAFKLEVLELLNSDRVEYNRVYGADNTYWMLQDNAMQLKWQPPARQPLSQPREWTFPYTVYMPEYDVSITDPELAAAYQRIRKAWGTTFPQLLLAPTDEEFDRIFNDYIALRDSMGYDLVAREWIRLPVHGTMIMRTQYSHGRSTKCWIVYESLWMKTSSASCLPRILKYGRCRAKSTPISFTMYLSPLR